MNRVMERDGVVSEQVHVLAVDDSLVDRKVIERLLKISACKVTVVDSGISALQLLGLDEQRTTSESDDFVGLKVDLIITDYCMPGMTGYDLLKKIKGSSTFREIPVVIMSSENILPRIDRCLEEGAKDFIVKPVKLSDVKRLKNYMSTATREVSAAAGGFGGGGGGGGGINKRKLSDTSTVDDMSSSPPSISPSITPSSSSSPSDSSSPSPSPLSSPIRALDSPIRRLKMSSAD